MPHPAAPPHRARLAVSLCFAGNGLLFATWGSRIPAVKARLGLTDAALGLSLLGLGLGATVAMPVAGWACGRWGSRRVTGACAAVVCALLPLLALAPNRLWLTAVLALFGAVHGGWDVAMNAQAVAVEARSPRPVMSTFHALWSAGALGGAALGGALAKAGLPPPLHFLAAALGIGVGLAATALPWLLPPEPAAPPAPGAPRPALLRLPRRIVALGAIAFCVMMGEGAMADWSALFLREGTGATEALAAAGYAAFAGAMAAGRFTGDALTARFGPVALLRGSGALAVAGLTLALGLAQTWPALVGLAAVGAGFATVVPLVFSAAGRTRGLGADAALAATTTLGYSGFLIGPPLIGFLASQAGLRLALGLIVLTSSLLVVLARQVAEAAPEPAGHSLEELT